MKEQLVARVDAGSFFGGTLSTRCPVNGTTDQKQQEQDVSEPHHRGKLSPTRNPLINVPPSIWIKKVMSLYVYRPPMWPLRLVPPMALPS